jgi:hypothetical protein
MTKTCRKCGTAFSDDLKTCPVCKTAIIGEQVEANANVTASYAALRDKLELVSLKSRYLTSFLFFIVGFLGMGWFYLGNRKLGFIHGLVSVVSLALSWVIEPSSVFTTGLLLAIGQTVLSLYYLFNPDAKDARGELLK